MTSISAIDARDGSFRMAGYAWFVDPTGAFDPEEDVVFIARSATHDTFAERTLPDGAAYTAVSFDIVVDHAFDVRDYPFDRQDLILQFEAARDTAVIGFAPDSEDSRIANFVRAPGWQIGDLDVHVSEKTYDTGFGNRTGEPSFSRFRAVVDIQRNLSPFLFEKFTGFFVALVITVMVLFVPVYELGTRVGMTTGSIFAAVFNRYRMEDALGFDAAFGLADQVSLLTFSAILQILMLSLLSHHLWSKDGRKPASKINARAGTIILGVHMMLIAIAFGAALT